MAQPSKSSIKRFNNKETWWRGLDLEFVSFTQFGIIY